MADIVNLRTVKKQAARKAARSAADANAVKFGRSKTQKKLDEARAEKTARDLDSHRRESD